MPILDPLHKTFLVWHQSYLTMRAQDLSNNIRHRSNKHLLNKKISSKKIYQKSQQNSCDFCTSPVGSPVVFTPKVQRQPPGLPLQMRPRMARGLRFRRNGSQGCRLRAPCCGRSPFWSKRNHPPTKTGFWIVGFTTLFSYIILYKIL